MRRRSRCSGRMAHTSPARCATSKRNGSGAGCGLPTDLMGAATTGLEAGLRGAAPATVGIGGGVGVRLRLAAGGLGIWFIDDSTLRGIGALIDDSRRGSVEATEPLRG